MTTSAFNNQAILVDIILKTNYDDYYDDTEEAKYANVVLHLFHNKPVLYTRRSCEAGET